MSNITIRVDDELKQQAETLFDDLGLNMTTAMNVFLRQAVLHRGIPFDISLNIPNSETIAAINNVNNNRNISKTFSSVSELIEDLNA